MFMPFYYYQNGKCLGRAVRGAEKDLNLALIGHCGYFHFSLWQLKLLFCGQFTEVLRTVFSRHLKSLELSDIVFELLMQSCTFNVQPANLHKIFSRFKVRHDRPIQLTQCCDQFKPFGNKTFSFRNFIIIIIFISLFFYCKFYRIQQVVRRGDLKKPPGLQVVFMLRHRRHAGGR